VTHGLQSSRHTSYVSWAIIISIVSKPSGLSIEIAKQFEPRYDFKTEGLISPEGSRRITDPKTYLEPKFPGTISLKEALKSLKKFETVSNAV
jgi:hypothetical protein